MSFAIEKPSLPLERDADGVVRVGATRVTLQSVITAFDLGATAEEIVQQFPSLSLADVYSVIGYCLNHRDAVDSYLNRRARIAADVRRQNESRSDPKGIRERLLARRCKSIAGFPESPTSPV